MDANVLFDLKEIDAMHMLNEVFSEVMIAQDTLTKELDPDTLQCLKDVKYVSAVITSEKGYEVYAQCHTKKSLSHCDKIAIALAAENGYLLCTNEGPARKQANTLKVEVAGTLGIIAAAYQNKLIDGQEAQRLFIYLSTEGSCYISKDLLNRVLDDLGLNL